MLACTYTFRFVSSVRRHIFSILFSIAFQVFKPSASVDSILIFDSAYVHIDTVS